MYEEHTTCIPLEGWPVRLPQNVEVQAARKIPDFTDVPMTRMSSCNEVFGCFAETLTLAVCKHKGNYGLGATDPALANQIVTWGKGIGFSQAPLQFFGRAIPPQRFQQAESARKKFQNPVGLATS